RDNHDYQGKDEQGNPILRHTTPYPILLFKGRVKVHGTNAGLVLNADGSIDYQSRERLLSIGSDNAGFCTYMSGLPIHHYFMNISQQLETPCQEYIAIYGEWCGGSIQKGVAISGMEKAFIVFDVVVDGIYRPDLIPLIDDPGN